MRKSVTEKIKTITKKSGFIGLAILMCLAERGVLIVADMFGASKGKSLQKSLAEIDDLKTVEDYYDILKNLNQNTTRTIIWRLEKKGLIKKSQGKLSLTDAGSSFYEKIKIKNNKEKNWDKKFRIAMFDVPESRKGQREYLRHALIGQNYTSLQKSVFIGKHPLDADLIQRLIEKDLYQHLHLILVGDIDNEAILENLV